MGEDRREVAKSVLLREDATSLERRCERLSAIPRLTFSSAMSNRTFALLSEACSCFVNGEYNGCISVLATAVEFSLRELLHSRSKLQKLIKMAKEQRVLKEEQAEALDKLREHRNNVVHSDLPSLARGIALKVQDVTITEKGVVATSDWREIQPDSETMQEVAGSLAVESTLRDILLDTRRILCELYAGAVEEDG